MLWHLDRPHAGRPHRVYVALTNHCNRACPWCSTCSSPRGNTWLPADGLEGLLPAVGRFELQLEGGEPTLHPSFFALVDRARRLPGCERMIVSTNGTTLPRARDELRRWVDRLGTPVTLKVSVNHHLLERDPGHVERIAALGGVVKSLAGSRLLVVNARFRSDVPGEEAWMEQLLGDQGLLDHANVLPLQRYGLASDRRDWPAPTVPWNNFTLVNPDRGQYGADLLARSEAMRLLL